MNNEPKVAREEERERLRGTELVRKLFPYWWFAAVIPSSPDRSPAYVIRREALKQATEDNNGRLTSSTPATVPPAQILDSLYFVLSVLDTKASALMRLNGVMLAAATFLLGLIPRPEAMQLLTVSRRMTLTIAVLSAISIALCLIVVSIDWPFLGLVRQKGDRLDFTEEIDHLGRVSLFRQFVFRTAWLISFAAAVLFIISFVSGIVCTVKAPKSFNGV